MSAASNFISFSCQNEVFIFLRKTVVKSISSIFSQIRHVRSISVYQCHFSVEHIRSHASIGISCPDLAALTNSAHWSPPFPITDRANASTDREIDVRTCPLPTGMHASLVFQHCIHVHVLSRSEIIELACKIWTNAADRTMDRLASTRSVLSFLIS